ncbi:MAG: TRAP transporter substrate-binding protein [Pseudomonadota bacterium]
MPSHFRTTLVSAATFALGAVLPWGSLANAADVTLTLSHFLSPKSATQVDLIEPWAQRIEEQSEGRIEIKIFPAMTLGGKPGDLYRQVRDGSADLVWTLPGYTPGVFPRSEVFELPTVHQGSAEATTMAIHDNFELIAEDFEELHPILVHTHAGQALMMRDECVTSAADLEGKKIRTPSRTGGWLISEWGAEPVGMPLPALPEAMAKGAVDGAMIPFEIAPTIRAAKFSKCGQTGADDARFGTALFLFAMNKDRYESMPDDLRAIIDANSGRDFALYAGELWDSAEVRAKEMQIEQGQTVDMLDDGATDTLTAAADAVIERWVEEVNDTGIDGNALVEAARAAVNGQGS